MKTETTERELKNFEIRTRNKKKYLIRSTGLFSAIIDVYKQYSVDTNDIVQITEFN